MNIHLIGICGAAMGNLAAMFRETGHVVTGTDQDTYPPMSDKLADLGIEVRRFDEPFSPDADLYIIGNAVSRGNPVLEAVLNSGRPYMSMPEALAEFFLKDKEVVVVAGSHGKSTTTAMLSFALERSGHNPSWFYGGVGLDGQPAYKLGSGGLFIIEGDEYDSAYFDKTAKFFHYKPKYLIITSLEYDHADIYHSVEEIQLAFARLVNMVPTQGLVIANFDYSALREVLRGYGPYRPRTPTIGYGLLKKIKKKLQKENKKNAPLLFQLFADEQYYELKPDKDSGVERVYFPQATGSGIDIEYRLPHIGRVRTKIFGEHNALNMTAVTLLMSHLGIPGEAVKDGLAAFPGIRRRQNIIQTEPFILIDDFAHHPTAVYETIRAVRQTFTGYQVWAVFEPRSATAHLNTFQNEWPYSFRKADKVFLVPPHNPKKFAKKRMLNVKKVIKDLKPPGYISPSPEELFTLLEQKLHKRALKNKKKPVILVMSNGGFGGIVAKLAAIQFPPASMETGKTKE